MQKIDEGKPLPLGASIEDEGVNFALFSQHATKISLWVKKENEEFEIHLDPKKNRTKDIWHVFVPNLKPPFLYTYRLNGPHEKPHYFHPHHHLTDPYAKALDTSSQWGECRKHRYDPKSVVPETPVFDWEESASPQYDMKDLIIYEMHVRGFTQHPSSKVKNPGKFLGIIEKIPYLKKLGINAIELMPIQEFHECSYSKNNPQTHQPLCNFWGYSTVNFLTPMNRYATSYHSSINEFKTLVRELHKNGIEVILDIVFNHTAEKGKNEGLFSFMGIDHSVYYMLENGHHTNFTGCGHTMNLNHPALRKFVQDVLHYWVKEMRVDGFRFDLASVMNRDVNGKLLNLSDLVDELSHDPVLAKCKLIAEPWDLAAYQLGAFLPHEDRWSEWNGRYRDTIRSFIKGDMGSKNDFAKRISGSEDIFPSRKPSASINFVTAHDGFTLHDLVSYEKKHNEMNGEHNKDGNNQNISWNMGHEGETEDTVIRGRRERQMKNFIVALMISKGTPMILMGDEYGHTKKGNNNTWCHDNELNWFLWDKKSLFFDFVKNMIRFRKEHPVFTNDQYYKEGEIIWHGMNLEDPNWHEESPIIAFTIHSLDEQHIYIAFNATAHEIHFKLPPPNSKNWYQIVNTNSVPSEDFFPSGKEKQIFTDDYGLAPYSCIVLKMM